MQRVGDGCTEQECFKVEKAPEAHSPGTWTDTWRRRGVGGCPSHLGAASWEPSVGTEQTLEQEGLEGQTEGTHPRSHPKGGGEPPKVSEGFRFKKEGTQVASHSGRSV